MIILFTSWLELFPAIRFIFLGCGTDVDRGSRSQYHTLKRISLLSGLGKNLQQLLKTKKDLNHSK